MSKETLGLIILAVAAVNLYWAQKIYSLMKSAGSKEHVDACKAQARRLSRLSKLSYIAVIASVGWFFVYHG